MPVTVGMQRYGVLLPKVFFGSLNATQQFLSSPFMSVILIATRGCPRKTWRTTVLEEMKSVAIGLGSAARLAQDRAIWRELVDALCATGNSEDE